MGHYNNSLSIDATIMVSKNYPITGVLETVLSHLKKIQIDK